MQPHQFKLRTKPSSCCSPNSKGLQFHYARGCESSLISVIRLSSSTSVRASMTAVWNIQKGVSVLQQTHLEFPRRESVFTVFTSPRGALQLYRGEERQQGFVCMRGELTALGEFGLLVRVYTAYKLQKKTQPSALRPSDSDCQPDSAGSSI